MGSILKKYEDIANKRNKEITCDMFNGDAVEVLHQDGSFFHIREALIEDVDDNVFIVYSEHHAPMICWREDLIEWRIVEI